MKNFVQSNYSRKKNGIRFKIFLWLFFVIMFHSANAQLQANGRFIYNKCGQKVIFRGIEHMLYYQDIDMQMVPEIAKTGTNSIRVLIPPTLAATTVRQILQKCITEHKMYVSLGLWSGNDFWFRADIKPVLEEFKDYLVIHAFGEAPYQTTDDDSRWISDAISIVSRLRNAGYTEPIDIQSTTYGRDPRPIIRHGQNVLNADPLKNIIFGCQMYWGDYYTGYYGMTIAQACVQFANLPFPVQVGACPSDCNTNCGEQAWDESYKNELGCMWWCWKGDEFQLSNNGNYNSLTSYGQYVVNTSAYSIKKTSIKSVPCTAVDAMPPSVPTGLAAASVTQTSFRLSWNPSTDNVGVIGYEVFRGGTSIGITTTTSFTVTGLSAGTAYNMTVRARDSVPNWSAQSAVFRVTTASASVNLALNRPATSSANESSLLNAPKAVDGNATTTRWSSPFSNPQWIYVDLGATYTINRVVLRWEVAYGRAYQIQTSNNATTWTNVFSTTTGNGAVDDIALSGTGRYIRMYGTVRGTTYGYSLYEFEVYGTSALARTIAPSKHIDQEVEESVAVFPNPVTGTTMRVNLFAEKQEGAILTLLNNSSQPVYELKRTLRKGNNMILVPVAEAANGIYFLRIRQGDKQMVKKIVIQK